MEATASIRFSKGALHCKLSPLQSAEIAASKYGFFDLDVEPDDRGVKITAMARNRTVVARGGTTSDAVDKLLGIFTE